jgi:hypothetical protein
MAYFSLIFTVNRDLVVTIMNKSSQSIFGKALENRQNNLKLKNQQYYRTCKRCQIQMQKLWFSSRFCEKITS